MAFVRSGELGARSVVVSCRWVVVLCCSVVGCGRWVVVGVVVLLFRFSGNSVAFVGVMKLRFFAFVYIFCSVGGVLSVWEHRAVGGSSDGGVKGIPLNDPRFG